MITLSVQFPVFDYSQGPFQQCSGRFEIYFNPKHEVPALYYLFPRKMILKTSVTYAVRFEPCFL
jgi:hypothetical protein